MTIRRTAHLISTVVPALWAGLVAGAGFIAVPAVFLGAGEARPFAYAAGARIFERLGMAEWAAALLLALAFAGLGLPKKRTVAFVVLAVLIALQAALLRPELAARAAILAAGGAVEPSPAHALYSTLELCKLAWLLGLAFAGWRTREQ